MRSVLQSFRLDSLHSSSTRARRKPTTFPDKLQTNKRLTMALQLTATGGGRVSRWLLPADPPTQPARHAPPPSAVAELVSFADFTRLPESEAFVF